MNALNASEAQFLQQIKNCLDPMRVLYNNVYQNGIVSSLESKGYVTVQRLRGAYMRVSVKEQPAPATEEATAQPSAVAVEPTIPQIARDMYNEGYADGKGMMSAEIARLTARVAELEAQKAALGQRIEVIDEAYNSCVSVAETPMESLYYQRRWANSLEQLFITVASTRTTELPFEEERHNYHNDLDLGGR